MIAQLSAQAAHLVYALLAAVAHLPAPVQAALGMWLLAVLIRKVASAMERRVPPGDREWQALDHRPPRQAPSARPAGVLPGHRPGCACLACKAQRQRSAPAEPAGAAMPAPSAGVAPPPAAAPCTHGGGVEAVWAGGELMRYTCANFRCGATWPPGTAFPAGTAIHGTRP